MGKGGQREEREKIGYLALGPLLTENLRPEKLILKGMQA